MVTLYQNYSLKKLNTFGIEAAAAKFAAISTLEDLKEIISDKNLYEQSQSPFILGGGSNLLFTRDVDNLVIKNELKGIQTIKEDKDYFYVRAQAGEVWHSFVLHCIEQNYSGLENLSLIPGNVGASPMQNIGAYGVEIKDHFFELEALHIPTMEVHRFDHAACEFGYRESVFKRKLKNQYIILSVCFRLPKKPVFNTSYGAIEKELENMKVQQLSIKAISEAVCNIRRSKLPDPSVTGNAGSFFKNPEIGKEQFEQLQKEFPLIVGYALENSNVKLAAGWLIEQCGWKGKTRGNAGVHPLQALVLINTGNATGKEVYDLSTAIMEDVQKKFNVTLEREVNIL